MIIPGSDHPGILDRAGTVMVKNEGIAARKLSQSMPLATSGLAVGLLPFEPLVAPLQGAIMKAPIRTCQLEESASEKAMKI